MSHDQKYSNNAYSTLVSSILTTDTAIFVQPGYGDRWPVIAAPGYCYSTLEDASGNIEIVKVTARNSGSDALTVVRGQQGTVARAYGSGDLVELRQTAEELNRYERAALRDGDTYTGTHDFTGAEIDVALQPLDDNTVKAASTSFVYRGLTYKANLESPVFTGIPRGPTAAFGAGGTQLATLDFVNAVSFASALPGQTGNAGKLLTTNGINALWVANLPPVGSIMYLANNFGGF